MDEGRRRSLTERREGLQRRLLRQEESATFRALAPLLCEQGARFSKVPPSMLTTPLRFLEHVPGRDERVYWREIAGGVCKPWHTASECTDLLRAALIACGAGRVLLVSHPIEAGLSIDAGSLAAAWPQLHLCLHGTVWLISRAGAGWLIEISYWDHELCYHLDLTGR